MASTRAADLGHLTTATSRAILLRAASRARDGALALREGTAVRLFGHGKTLATVTVNDPRSYRALLTSGSVGLGRSYVEGWWDADDLTGVVQALYRWSTPMREVLDRLGRAPLPWIGPRPRRPDLSPRADRRNIAAHYDLSNEFFEMMLDPTMSYSCAIFAGTTATGTRSTLEAAQVAKLDRICEKLELNEHDHLVEVGTGWGGLAVHAAAKYGCRVTTTTISQAQREYATKRVADAGLSHLVSVLGEDWRDLQGKYNKLVSVEMIEAVDWRLYSKLMRRFSDLLHDDGVALVQAIVIDDASYNRAKRHKDFIRDMVFPGSCIPSVQALVSAMASGSDLRLVGLEDIGAHYAPTLAAWASNLRDKRPSVDDLGIPEHVQRMWALYLAYCEASFLEGHISDVQILLAKPGLMRRRGGQHELAGHIDGQ
ncbi:MAG TPA: cyclopropane-fatty-acyl-phospholipid synthase family protein [Acidimicrobiales bacterium]|nr:cyclopropane-fatty-acyl-phospholipid synthase family protein [Acidimicrobiales bacterium]